MNSNTQRSNRFTTGTHLLALAAILPLLSGCINPFGAIRPGPLRTETQTIEAKGATAARVELEMGAGELTLGGGASELAQANFTYNVDAWKPIVSYTITNGIGRLMIHQPSFGMSAAATIRNEWDISLNNTLPTDLKVQLGAGKSMLNLSSLVLSAVDIECGAGETAIDLSGTWAKTTSIKISGGVGQLSVRLPKDVGVRVKADTGIGNTNATGLSKDGNVYTNAAYGTSPITLNLDIEAGVGEIRLDVVNP
jgi:N-terminal domain of toast_rack, DUF2154